jgi:hypothetical protein
VTRPTNGRTLYAGAHDDIFNTPSAFTFSKVNFETRHAYEEIWQGRIDYTTRWRSATIHLCRGRQAALARQDRRP